MVTCALAWYIFRLSKALLDHNSLGYGCVMFNGRELFMLGSFKISNGFGLGDHRYEIYQSKEPIEL